MKHIAISIATLTSPKIGIGIALNTAIRTNHIGPRPLSTACPRVLSPLLYNESCNRFSSKLESMMNFANYFLTVDIPVGERKGRRELTQRDPGITQDCVAHRPALFFLITSVFCCSVPRKVEFEERSNTSTEKLSAT